MSSKDNPRMRLDAVVTQEWQIISGEFLAKNECMYALAWLVGMGSATDAIRGAVKRGTSRCSDLENGFPGVCLGRKYQ